ncbi:hypothetical protein Tco_0569456 [Tanacetum coccineum]
MCLIFCLHFTPSILDSKTLHSSNDLGSDLDVSSPSEDRNKIYDPWICIEVESTRFLATLSPVMAALVFSISSDVSVESVGSSFPRVILIGSISVEVSIAPEVGAAAVALPVRVLELDTHSSSDADPSESSPPLISVAPMVSPHLCSDDSESDTEIPERHVSPTPHDVMLTR